MLQLFFQTANAENRKYVAELKKQLTYDQAVQHCPLDEKKYKIVNKIKLIT